MDSYRIPTKSGASEYVDKRSRFLGLVRPVGSEDEARTIIAACKKQYHDARHNCWCYLLRDGTERYSDDGEPQGTAGIPMLEVFRRAGVTNAVCVVTRYFGGVLLGTGGLVRAYSKALKDAAVSANRAVMIPCTVFSCSADYTDSARLSKLISDMGGVTENAEYTEKVSLTFSMRESKKSEFELKLKEMFCARITAKEIKTELRPVSEL